MPKLRTLIVLALFAIGSTFTTDYVAACPFCSAVSQTFSEEISTMDVVAIAQLQKAGEVSKISSTDPQAEFPSPHLSSRK